MNPSTRQLVNLTALLEYRLKAASDCNRLPAKAGTPTPSKIHSAGTNTFQTLS